MARVSTLVSLSLATLLGASLWPMASGCTGSSDSKRALQTPKPSPSPPEEPGSLVPASGTGTGPRSPGTHSNAEGPGAPARGAAPGGSSVVGPGGARRRDTGGVPASHLSCVEYQSCSVDKPCIGGLHCVRIEDCMSALCMTPQAACEAICGKPDCSILESYPAQISCSGGPGEPPAPEPDVIAQPGSR